MDADHVEYAGAFQGPWRERERESRDRTRHSHPHSEDAFSRFIKTLTMR